MDFLTWIMVWIFGVSPTMSESTPARIPSSQRTTVTVAAPSTNNASSGSTAFRSNFLSGDPERDRMRQTLVIFEDTHFRKRN